MVCISCIWFCTRLYGRWGSRTGFENRIESILATSGFGFGLFGFGRVGVGRLGFVVFLPGVQAKHKASIPINMKVRMNRNQFFCQNDKGKSTSFFYNEKRNPPQCIV